MTTPATGPLDPATLAKLRNLELAARRVVEGYLSGGHRSPRHGFAVEFAQHREYAPGDDTRHIDWKVLGRTERHYLKQYEQDTNLVCWLLVDRSESMRFGSAGVSKYDYACLAAAALAHLVVRQSDSVGLATFDGRVRTFLRPAGQPTHLKEVVRLLLGCTGPEKTNLGATLHELADRAKRRGVVVLLSDLFDDPGELRAGLQHLRYNGHEVVVLQVVDPTEVDFPFEEATLFRGLEGAGELLTDPRGVREGYLSEFGAFLAAVRSACRGQNADHELLRTDADLGTALAAYLSRRAKR